MRHYASHTEAARPAPDGLRAKVLNSTEAAHTKSMSTFASNGHLQELITELFKSMETRRDRLRELSGSQSEPAERIPQPWPSYLKETLTLVR